MTVTIIDKVSKNDAKKLVKWYNANTTYYHFPDKMDHGKLWKVIRQIN
jgi:hypothetical protein